VAQRPRHQPGVRELKDPVRAKIDRYELTDTIDSTHFFPTIGSAVHAYRELTGTRWPEPDQDEPT